MKKLCHLTSRQIILRLDDPPNKRKMTPDEMLKVAFLLGKGETMRDIGDSLNRSPIAVYKVKKELYLTGNTLKLLITHAQFWPILWHSVLLLTH